MQLLLIEKIKQSALPVLQIGFDKERTSPGNLGRDTETKIGSTHVTNSMGTSEESNVPAS